MALPNYLMGKTFTGHVARCLRCQQYIEDKPATCAACCLDGAILLKEAAAKVAPRKPRAPKSDFIRPKAEVKAATRYK